MNVKDYVEFFVNGSKFPSDGIGQYKLRMIVGHKIKGIDYYSFTKHGMLFEITKQMKIDNPNIDWYEERASRAIKAAQKTWDEIESQEYKYEEKLYGYHFGMPYYEDEDGGIVGDWPLIVTATIYCEDNFLMRSGELPDKYKYLKPFSWPQITGKCLGIKEG